MRGHDFAGDQRVFREMNRQTETGETFQDLIQLLQSPVSLMLMALNADGADRDIRLQQRFDQFGVAFACVEIVDEQGGVRIAFFRGGENLLHEADAAFFLADPGDRVVIPVKLGHDDNLVDNIPQVNDAAEGLHIPVNPRDLAAEDFLVGELKQPGSAGCMPAEGMPFDLDAFFTQPFRGGHGFGIGGPAFLGLIAAPVEGKGTVIEQGEPFFHTFLQEGFLRGIIGFHDCDSVKGAAAEKEPVRNLIHVDLLTDCGSPVRIQDAQAGVRPAVCKFILIHKVYPSDSCIFIFILPERKKQASHFLMGYLLLFVRTYSAGERFARRRRQANDSLFCRVIPAGTQ